MTKKDLQAIHEHRLTEWYSFLREIEAHLPGIEKLRVGKLKTMLWSEIYGRNKSKTAMPMYENWKDEMRKL